MFINTEKVISITDANQNFTKAAKLADKCGEAYIYKRNKPCYILISLENNAPIEMTDEEKIMFVGRRVLAEHISAFKELAK